MSEMVERVARAICTARRWSPENWDLAKDEARAAIEAMREPEPAMVRALAIYASSAKAWSRAVDEALK